MPLFVVVYSVLTLLLIVRVPLGQAPDEAAHWEYARHIATQHALPIFMGAPPPQPGYEFHQPPLYYLLCAPFWMLLNDQLASYSSRIVSALFGLATLVLIGKAARHLWPQRDDFMVLATGFAALWPLHLSVSAASGNDAAAGFFCAALFYGMARGGTQGWNQRDVLWIGCCAGLGLWAKTTTLPVSIVTLLLAWGLSRQERAPHYGRLPAPVVMALVGLIVAAPLLIRNQLLYGDPLGWSAFAQAATAGTPGFPLMSQAGISFFVYVRGLLLILFCTAWGFFGGPGRAVNAIRPLAEAPQPLPAPLLPLVAVCALATLVGVIGLVRPRTPMSEADDENSRVVMRWWYVGLLLIFLGWAQFAYQHFSGAQARYLHPALLPMCVLGALAWSNIFVGRTRLIATLFFGGTLLTLTLLNLFVWRTLV